MIAGEQASAAATPADSAANLSAENRSASGEASTVEPGTAPPSVSVPISLVVVAASAGLITAAYWQSFLKLADVWSKDPNYSHGFFVPVISLVFAAMAAHDAGSPVRRDATAFNLFSGSLAIVFGIALHAVATLISVLLADVASLIFVILGWLLLVGGRPAMKHYGFAAAFLIFMAPLPMQWYQPLALSLQTIASVVATATLDTMGFAVFREGYMIHMAEGATLEVAEACSGMRQLTAVIALATALGHLSRRGLAYTLVLTLCALPVAVAANCVRVVATALIQWYFGTEWIQGAMHEWEGLVMIGLSAVIILAIAGLVAGLQDRVVGKSTES